MRKTAKVLSFIFSIFSICTIAVFVWYSAVTKDVKFDSEKLKKIEAKYEIFDKNNKKIQPSLNQKSIAADTLPNYVKDAFIAHHSEILVNRWNHQRLICAQSRLGTRYVLLI